MKFNLDQGLSFRRKQKLTGKQKIRVRNNQYPTGGAFFAGSNSSTARGCFLCDRDSDAMTGLSCNLEFPSDISGYSSQVNPLNGTLFVAYTGCASNQWWKIILVDGVFKLVCDTGTYTFVTTFLFKEDIVYNIVFKQNGGNTELLVDGKKISEVAVTRSGGITAIGAEENGTSQVRCRIFYFARLDGVISDADLVNLQNYNGELIGPLVKFAVDAGDLANTADGKLIWVQRTPLYKGYLNTYPASVSYITAYRNNKGIAASVSVSLPGLDAGGYNEASYNISLGNAPYPSKFSVTVNGSLPSGVSVTPYRSSNVNYVKVSSTEADAQSFTLNLVINYF